MNKLLVVDVWDQRQRKQEFIRRLVTEKFDDIMVFTQNEWEYLNIFDELVPPLLGYFLEHSGTNINVITSLFNPLPTYPKYKGYNLHCWGTYWLYKTYGLLKGSSLLAERKAQKDNAHGLKYHYVMLNNRTHEFRCKLIDKLAERDVIKQGAISWNNTDKFLMNGYVFKHFHGNDLILDHEYKTVKGQYSPPDQYFESFVQLISESTPNHLFFSEKISIALITGKPFIAAAGVGLHTYLRDNLGFKLYDEIFDYSFDNQPDMNTRWNMIADNIHNICKYSLSELEELNAKIKHKVVFNQLRAKEIVLDTDFMPLPIQKCLNLYKNKNYVHDKLVHNFQNIDGVLELGPEWDLI